LEAIESLQSDNDRDVRFFAGCDEEVPYEGRGYPDDPTYMGHNRSPESEHDEIGVSPLDGEFAEEQIEAKLMAVEITDRGQQPVTGIPLEVGSDEGFEEADQCLGDDECGEHYEGAVDESRVHHEVTGVESGVDNRRTGDESGVHNNGDESRAVEETEHDETEVTQSEEELNKDDEVDTSTEPEETPVVNEG
jgi:hypothetical protein